MTYLLQFTPIDCHTPFDASSGIRNKHVKERRLACRNIDLLMSVICVRAESTEKLLLYTLTRATWSHYGRQGARADDRN